MTVPAGNDGTPIPAADAPQGKPTPYGQPPKADWRRWARLSAWGVVAIVAALFLLTNRVQVPISFVFADVTAPLWVALIVSIVLGFLLGWGAAWFRARRRRDRID